MLSLPRRALQREMKRLGGSVLFQGEDYAKRAGVPSDEALAHFCEGGWRARIDPSPFFSVEHYLSKNPDVVAGGLNPLLHYLETGWAEGRSGHPEFNAEGYRRAHPEAAGSDLLSDCVRRYWSLSWPGADEETTLLGGSVLFQAEDYAARTGVEPASALQHFNGEGWRARIDPSPFFDVEHYLTTNPDVADADVNPLAHYVRTGWAEGRWGHPTFHPGKYMAAHPDAAGRDPLADCVRRYWTLAWPGSVEEAPPEPLEIVRGSPYFDAAFYLDANADVAAAELDPAEHYLVSGAQEFRNPSAGFDTWFYVRSNPEVAPAGAGALIHYTEVGHAEGRLTRPQDSVVLQPHPDPGALGEGFPLRVAVHLHLSRPELLHEIVAALRSIPVAYAVFCSVYGEADRVFALRYFARTAPGVPCEVRVVAREAGGALGSLLVAFGDVWGGYDLLCHLHTALNPDVGDAQLRPLQLNALLGGPELVGASLQTLLDEPDLGFLFPENPHLIKAFVNWGDLDGLAWLRRRLRLEAAPLPAVPDYPAGSMGWFRPAAFAEISVQLAGEAFQADPGLANGLEKFLPTLVRSAGLRAVVYYAAQPQRLALPEPDHVGFGQDDPPATRWRKSMPALAAERPAPLAPGSRVFNPEALALHWIVPNLTRGSGGHMSVLRIVKLLAGFGHRQTIWIRDVEPGLTPAAAKARIREWYQPIGEDVYVRFLPDDMNALSGDAIIATHCSTVFPALATAAVKERFYFVQDYEPLFSPMGDEHLAAEATYRMGLAGLCAGPWLLEKAQAHGMWARAWDLAPDREFYFPALAVRAPRPRPRVAFYCRSHTPRRAAHLGFAAFQALRDRGVEFELVLFGEEAQPRPLDFPFEDAGLLTPEQLGDLYRDCDLGVVFSTTNYSLIPLEMMACGLPVLELDGESTRAVFRSGEAALAQPEPNAIADAIAALLADGDARLVQAERGHAGVAELSWETSARAVERAIRERLAERGFGEVRPAEVCGRVRAGESRAAVVIPTYNGGDLFRRVLERAAGQATRFDYEVLVVDSSSTDGTAEFVREFGGRVRLHGISKADFQHGRTRNLAISMTQADHIALLTQDALPADDGWLAKLVGGFSAGEKVGGVVGSHRAYPEHDAFAARDVGAHFHRLHDYGVVLSLERGLPSFIYPGGHQWQDALQFFSDNNACLLRAAWEILPYPEVEWGEDQLWAWRLLQLGFEKAYVHEAAVFHSHAYAPPQEAEVAEAAGWFWKRWFGRDSYGSEAVAEAAVLRTGEEDLRYAIAHGVPRTDLQARARRTRAAVFGRLEGARRGARPDPGT